MAKVENPLVEMLKNFKNNNNSATIKMIMGEIVKYHLKEEKELLAGIMEIAEKGLPVGIFNSTKYDNTEDKVEVEEVKEYRYNSEKEELHEKRYRWIHIYWWVYKKNDKGEIEPTKHFIGYFDENTGLLEHISTYEVPVKRANNGMTRIENEEYTYNSDNRLIQIKKVFSNVKNPRKTIIVDVNPETQETFSSVETDSIIYNNKEERIPLVNPLQNFAELELSLAEIVAQKILANTK